MVTVLSCNLFSGRADSGALSRLIDEHRIDIVCAQELSRAHVSALRQELPYGDLDHDQITKGNGIACRYPVETRRIAMPKRDGWEVTLLPEHWDNLDVPVRIVNVHISAPHLWPYFPHPVRRSEQLHRLLEDQQRNAQSPHAIFGDFNASPAWRVYRRMAEIYTDGARTGTLNGGAAATWPRIPFLRINGLLRIDHCFLWKLGMRQLQRVAIPGSDHFGLLAKLEANRMLMAERTPYYRAKDPGPHESGSIG